MSEKINRMNAVYISEYGKEFDSVKIGIPEPEQNEIRVKVVASGLCSTDLHIRDGRMNLGKLPRIPGHETAGIIDAVGDGVEKNWIGQRVTVAIDIPCGKCRHCLSGHTNRCQSLTRIGFERDGGHADYVVVPKENVIPLPDDVSFEAASILPDAVACMYHCLMEQGNLRATDKVLILGAGGLGIHGIQIAKFAGAEVVATSRNSARRKIAEEYGAIAANPNDSHFNGYMNEITQNEGFDIVADCVGTQASIRQSLDLVRAGGKVLVIAYIDEEFILPSLDLFLREKEVIGCRGSTKQDLIQVTDLVGKGIIDPVIGERFNLRDINKAAQVLENGDVIGRIVLKRDYS